MTIPGGSDNQYISERTLDRVKSYVIPAVIALVTALSTYWSVQARTESRIAVIEAKQEQLIQSLVPRNETNARWDALDKRLNDIQTDVRELRSDFNSRRK
jgi:Flp pilus assembly protein TadB